MTSESGPRKSRLLGHLSEVARERDPYKSAAGHGYVREYIRRHFARFGHVQVHEFEHLGRTHQNLAIDFPGQKPGLTLVGAHFDGVPGTPGADDNGSAVAALLEMAECLSQEAPRSGLRLVAFDLEERNTAGSRAYATHLRDIGQPISLMIALEMLGYRDMQPGSQRYPAGLRHFYPDRGDFIGLIGNLRALPKMWRLKRRMTKSVRCEMLAVPLGGRIVPDTRRSDHAPFWDLGYPALMVTDTADLRNPHYHTPRDRIETLDLDFLTAVCTGLIDGVRAL